MADRIIQGKPAPMEWLTKLLLEVRTPDPGQDPAELDDFAWVDTTAVSQWVEGWTRLQAEGWIELKLVRDAYDMMNDRDVHAVRFTKKGLNYAIDTVMGDGVKTAQHQEAVAQAAGYYDTNPACGAF